MELYLIRHGESIGNTKPGIDMPDSALSEKGHKQAERAAIALSQMADIDMVYSSPLVRSLSTAKPFLDLVKKDIHVMKELSEYRTGPSHIGPSYQQLKQAYPELVFNDTLELEGWHYEGNESTESVCKRANHCIDYLLSKHAEDNVAVFSHGTFNHYLLSCLLNLDPEQSIRFLQHNACINHLHISTEAIKVHSLNNVSHLSQQKEVHA